MLVQTRLAENRLDNSAFSHLDSDWDLVLGSWFGLQTLACHFFYIFSIIISKSCSEWFDLIVLCNEEQSSFVQEPVETFQNTLEINWVELTQDHFHWNSTASCKYESSLQGWFEI